MVVASKKLYKLLKILNYQRKNAIGSKVSSIRSYCMVNRIRLIIR